VNNGSYNQCYSVMEDPHNIPTIIVPSLYANYGNTYCMSCRRDCVTRDSWSVSHPGHQGNLYPWEQELVPTELQFCWWTCESWRLELLGRLHDFKRGHQPRSHLGKNENGDLLADSHNTLNSGRNTSLTYWMYTGSEMLGRQKYIQPSCQYLILAPLRLKLLLQSWKGINRQVVIKFQQNRFKQEVKYYVRRFIS
jgi:hypothetical protein